MKTRYMLDTNTASHIIKDNVPYAHAHLLKMHMSQVCISSITQGELLFGVAKKDGAAKLRLAVHEFLLRVDILPWDSDAAEYYAELRVALERVGTPLGNLDTLIAAHALATHSVLITTDKAFRHVKHLVSKDWIRH
jgi:tRNA(fMet)-specific endonuclease VapC